MQISKRRRQGGVSRVEVLNLLLCRITRAARAAFEAQRLTATSVESLVDDHPSKAHAVLPRAHDFRFLSQGKGW
jgi:hypothetical protein